MASAVSSPQPYIVKYGRLPEGMDGLRRLADPHVRLGRPVRDEFDDPNRSAYIYIHTTRSERIVAAIRLTQEVPNFPGPAFAWVDPSSLEPEMRKYVGNLRLVHLSRALVAPAYRGRGLASMLFLEAYQMALHFRFRHVVSPFEPDINITKFVNELFSPVAFQQLAVAHDTPGDGVPVRILLHRLDKANRNIPRLQRRLQQKLDKERVLPLMHFSCADVYRTPDIGGPSLNLLASA